MKIRFIRIKHLSIGVQLFIPIIQRHFFNFIFFRWEFEEEDKEEKLTFFNRCDPLFFLFCFFRIHFIVDKFVNEFDFPFVFRLERNKTKANCEVQAEINDIFLWTGSRQKKRVEILSFVTSGWLIQQRNIFIWFTWLNIEHFSYMQKKINESIEFVHHERIFHLDKRIKYNLTYLIETKQIRQSYLLIPVKKENDL